MSPDATHSQPADRATSYGQDWKPGLVDRFGVWLSTRQIEHYVGSVSEMRVGDLGCGYNATLMRRWLPRVQSTLLVDVALAADLKTNARVRAIEGSLPGALVPVSNSSIDVLVCNSVLEHVWDPLVVLREIRRLLAPGGVALLNVPSWRGKRYLEFSAFRLGLSPALEMDDHKMYYDVRDLWPLLVRAGFKPHNIRCFPHKFGLNVFAVCRADA
jgi:SAM-dependent methyltransferase